MTDAALPQSDDRTAKRNVTILILAQAFLGAQMPILFVIGGLAGQAIAPSPLWATAPISLIVFGSMTTSWWLAMVMQRFGRTSGFIIGALGGAAGAGLAGIGLLNASFPLFLVGSYLSGVYMSAQAFYRFAAAETVSESVRPKAISWVMAGGLLSALIGQQLVKLTETAMLVPFAGSYFTAAALNIAGLGLFFFLKLPRPKTVSSSEGRTRLEMLREPRILVAIICAMISYSLMNLMMTSTPLAVVGCGFTTGNASDVVSAHVIAMFAPSFFTGHLIRRFGVMPIMGTGLFLLAIAGAVALTGVALYQFFGALILLGLGWNFGFIGATTLLASCHTEAERGRLQGLNDTLVFGCVTIASLSSGALINSGETAAQGWTAVNLAMLPFLVIAASALLWLALRPKTQPA